MLQLTKLKEVGDLKDTLTSDMDIYSFEFAQLGFGLVTVQHFFIILLYFPIGTVMHILCHCILRVCGLLFNFDFTAAYS